MITYRHQDSVAIANDSYQFRVLGIRIDQLNAIGRAGHIEIDIHFLEHGGVFVGRPTRPVARVKDREPEKEPCCFDVLPDNNVDVALLADRAGPEAQRRISAYRSEGDELRGKL